MNGVVHDRSAAQVAHTWWARHRLHAVRSSEADAVAVRVVARVRVAGAVMLAASGSFLSNLTSDQSTVFLVLGLAWLPLATVVLFAADNGGHPLAVLGGPVIDAAALATVHALLPGTANATLLGFVVVVAFATYTGGARFGGLLAALGIGTTLLVRDVATTSHELELSTVALFAGVMAGIVFLVDRTAIVQSRTAARSARYEGKAEAILARVADGVVVTDARGLVLQWSPAAERILGTPARDAQGQACAEVLGLHVGERRLDCSNGCPLLAFDHAPDDVLGQEAWRQHTGRRQPLLVNASAVPGPDGSPVEVVHSVRDVTRLKQAEEAKTLFLATASHELKTPLTVISGFAATLLSGAELDDASRHQALEAINRRAGELTRIVDRLLLSSRIEAGRVQVATAAVDLLPVVTERVDAMRAARGRTVVLHAPDELPAVIADPQAVVTALDHLLDNALKYSPDGDPVTVSIVVDADDVHIAVRDQGIGMDAEQASRCFDKFWQAEASDVRRFGGTGIGLYIVRSLVEAIAGTITVESAPEHGSTFTMTFRRAGIHRLPEPQEDLDLGERSSIREFMRQIGVPKEVERS